jgi:hypothetical protein
MGADASFAGAAERGGAASPYGAWQCGARTVALELRRAGTSAPDAANLHHWITNVSGRRAGRELSGLVIAGPLTSGRPALERALAAARAQGGPAMAVVSLRALLTGVELVHAGRLTAAELIRIIDANTSIDFVIDLLARMAAPAATAPDAAGDRHGEPPRSEGISAVDATADSAAPHAPVVPPRGWVAAVAPDHATGPDQFLELVVARRRLFGVNEAGRSGPPARPGDVLAFYITGRGIVGRARVGAVDQGGTGLRDAHRYQHLLHLDEVVLHLNRPVPLDPETQLRLRTAPAAANRHAHTLVPMSSDLMAEIWGDDRPGAADAAWEPKISAADSH